MRSLVLLAAALAAGPTVTTPLAAQVAHAVEAAAMKPLQWLVGRWSGTGTMMTGPAERTEATAHETASTHAGGHVLMLEGLGTAESKVVHSAFAVIWYDAGAKTHRLRAFRFNGDRVDSDLAVTEKQLVWGFKDPRGANIRFTISHTDDGKWHEIGEYSADGATWHQFFDMTLARESGS